MVLLHEWITGAGLLVHLKDTTCSRRCIGEPYTSCTTVQRQLYSKVGPTHRPCQTQ
jgi:hypothetical protein